MELHGDLPPVKGLREPLEGGSTVGSVYFEGVKGWGCCDSNSSKDLPKSYPFQYFLILIDNFTRLKVKSRIRIHRRSLDEWLELVARVSRGSFKSKNSLNRFFSKNGISESVGNVRELLLFSPFHVVL